MAASFRGRWRHIRDHVLGPRKPRTRIAYRYVGISPPSSAPANHLDMFTKIILNNREGRCFELDVLKWLFLTIFEEMKILGN